MFLRPFKFTLCYSYILFTHHSQSVVHIAFTFVIHVLFSHTTRISLHMLFCDNSNPHIVLFICCSHTTHIWSHVIPIWPFNFKLCYSYTLLTHHSHIQKFHPHYFHEWNMNNKVRNFLIFLRTLTLEHGRKVQGYIVSFLPPCLQKLITIQQTDINTYLFSNFQDEEIYKIFYTTFIVEKRRGGTFFSLFVMLVGLNFKCLYTPLRTSPERTFQHQCFFFLMILNRMELNSFRHE